VKTEKKNTGTIAFRFRQVLLYKVFPVRKNHAMKGELQEYSFQFTSHKQFHACHQYDNLCGQAYFTSLAARHTTGTEVQLHTF
jgi:hypothetical protein